MNNGACFAQRLLRQRPARIHRLSQPSHNGFHNSPRVGLGNRPPQRLATRIPIRGVKTYAKPPTRFQQMVIDARTQHPVLFPFLLIACTGMASMLTLMAYDEYKRENSTTTPYPKPVEERLRLALHYTHLNPDPDTAAGYFVDAIKKAEELGMDPYSKEFVGIRVRFSEMLENFGHMRASIEILNDVVKDFEKRLSEMDAHPAATSGEAGAEGAEVNIRKHLVKTIIQAKVKLSSMWESEYMQDSTMAKNVLSDAVGLIVKETQDPQQNSFTEENGAGLSTGEIAAVLGQMGDLYATSGEEANAVQVYMLTLQPLRASCNGTKSCKEVQILSNIATTMTTALKKPNAKVNGKPVTKQSAAAARQAILKWADQAIATADAVKPEDRDGICELALLSAQMTRADVLLDSGNKEQAKQALKSLLPTLREKKLTPLITVAEESLKKAGG
ncbi:hypothetical protein PV10_04229 [Exophiala mesophila]|uniref:Uncharacterized protein n=1 Tax=Exophiala mesophila TaxID=212818 RepID=A0A0D1ZGR5_EXOME|nr:uncharacterized protein PV10_04229 [Exophiala mesophila]KIV92979.1 hypothetical protein PV10_04229 [Exophiala mesophila]